MAYLEHADEGLGEVVKVAAPHLGVLEVVPSPEELHAQQGEDDDEEEEQQQQGGDGADGVEQGCHQVAQRCPVPEEEVHPVGRRHSPLTSTPKGAVDSGEWLGVMGEGPLGAEALASQSESTVSFPHYPHLSVYSTLLRRAGD